MRLLVVEDDPLVRALLSRNLSRAGHQVEQAADGQEAWTLLQEDAIRLVITDWVMPRLDGLELVRRLRARATDGYTYLILLTGKGSKDDIVGGLNAGADDYLTKPFDAEELRARVRIGERILHLEAALKESRDHLAELALHDSLTGLLNRRAIEAQATAQWSRVERGEQPMSVVLLDIDHFKSVNDQHGHHSGDEALRLVAHLLRQSTRPYDAVGRWGGEEFLMVLAGADLSTAATLAERLRVAVGAAPLDIPDGAPLPLHISLGVASTSAGRPATLAGLIQQADQALYQAKSTGRDRVCLFTPPLPAGAP